MIKGNRTRDIRCEINPEIRLANTMRVDRNDAVDKAELIAAYFAGGGGSRLQREVMVKRRKKRAESR